MRSAAPGRRVIIGAGVIYRSAKFDHRNEAYRRKGGTPAFTSLILDAIKPL